MERTNPLESALARLLIAEGAWKLEGEDSDAKSETRRTPTKARLSDTTRNGGCQYIVGAPTI
jgi:hypothetical protein